MIIFIIALAIMCVVGIKFSFKDGFADYCSPEKNRSDKGHLCLYSRALSRTFVFSHP